MKNSSTKVISVTIIALVLIGTYYNSQQISQLKPVVLHLHHDLPSPTGRNSRRTAADDKQINSVGGLQQKASCLKARIDTVPPSMFGKLPRPFINLGFPKMGKLFNMLWLCTNMLLFGYISHCGIRSTRSRNLISSCIF